MNRKVFLIGLVIIVALLSFQVDSFEIILILFIFLSIIFLISAGVIRVFRRINSKIFTVPVLIIGVCLAGIIASLFRPYDQAVLESGNKSEKLQYAYTTDQKDRMQLKTYILDDINERDKVRLKQVKEILNQDKKLKPLDKFHAAFVYHHSDNNIDFETASKLATAAAKDPQLKDHYQAQWLRKAAYDRWMLSLGKPEKYNTQNKFSIGFE